MNVAIDTKIRFNSLWLIQL